MVDTGSAAKPAKMTIEISAELATKPIKSNYRSQIFHTEMMNTMSSEEQMMKSFNDKNKQSTIEYNFNIIDNIPASNSVSSAGDETTDQKFND